MIRLTECQVHYAYGVLETMFTKGTTVYEVRQGAYEAFCQRTDATHKKMVWRHPSVDSQYRDWRARAVAITTYRDRQRWMPATT